MLHNKLIMLHNSLGKLKITSLPPQYPRIIHHAFHCIENAMKKFNKKNFLIPNSQWKFTIPFYVEPYQADPKYVYKGPIQQAQLRNQNPIYPTECDHNGKVLQESAANPFSQEPFSSYSYTQMELGNVIPVDPGCMSLSGAWPCSDQVKNPSTA